MITTIISQRSFDNSWMAPSEERGSNPIPSGVVLDICVTCPADLDASSAYLQASADADGRLSASLVVRGTQSEIVIGTLITSITGIPVAFDCVSGAYASVLLGFIPTVASTVCYDAVRISDDLVIFHNLSTTTARQYRTLTLANDSTDTVSVALSSDKRIELDAGLHGELSTVGGATTLQVEYDKSVVEPSALLQSEIELSVDRRLAVFGGAKALQPHDTVYLNIGYGDVVVDVTGFPDNDNAQLAIINTVDTVTACDVDDPIDNYVGPQSYHEGTYVLDSIYGETGVRDISKLFNRTYGWGVSEDITKPDEAGAGCASLARPDTAFDASILKEV